MSGIFGALGLADSDRAFTKTEGQMLALDLINSYFARVTADIAAQMAIFVETETTNHTERYKLPGGGYLQARDPQSSVGNVKAYGGYDVAYPLYDFGAAVGGNDVAMAYMTVGDLERHVSTVAIQNVNTVRLQMLRRIFKNTTDTFVDEINGSLTIQPLANNDSVTYAPVLGSSTEATETHYLESGYAATAISDTNNPYTVIRAELEEHFGASTGGNNIVAFIHPDEVPETEDLSDFDPVEDNFIRSSMTVNVPINLPNVPGRIIGRTNGVWVVEWRYLPTGYAIGIDLEAPAPLKMRIDPADTGLGRGLQLVATQQIYPFQNAFYRNRFGFGAGNRLNGVVMEFGTGGSYSIPSGFS